MLISTQNTKFLGVNSLAYYGTELIGAVKSFTIQAQGPVL